VTLRGVPWAPVAAGSTCGAVILTGCVTIPSDGPPLGYARLALIVLAAATAFVLDEPAAAAVDATPASLRRRTTHRAAAALLPLTVWILGVLALQQQHAATPSAGLLLEGAGALSLAVALAAVLRRYGQAEPGDAVACGLGATLLGVLLLDPPPHLVPLFPNGNGWTASIVLWGVLTLAAVGLTVIGSQDPFLRQLAKALTAPPASSAPNRSQTPTRRR
jgi:hypothetical protein